MPSPVLTLRLFCLSDAKRVAPWLDGPGLGLPPGPAGMLWAPRLLGNARARAWVALEGDRPVGFARLDIGPDRVAELTLAVAPDQRRLGRGRAILNLVIEHAQQLRLRRLQAIVDRANEPAMAFFGENGFEEAEAEPSAARFVRWIHDANRQVLEIDA